MPVSELGKRVTSSELSEWIAWDRIQPFGEMREDLRAGMIAAPLLNIWIPKGKKRAKASDWIMEFDSVDEEKKIQSPEVMKMLLSGLSAFLNSTPSKKGKKSEAKKS